MYDVTVVMPVYNEDACITGVVDDWLRELDGLDISYRLTILNDGSKDATAARLNRYNGDPRVLVINKQNSGHGPTILMGYRLAAEEAHRVFQVDSDNEMEACHFEKAWAIREGCDAVIGVRDGRKQPLPRKIISLVSRCIVSVFYGTGVTDVNCPFRLMRSDALKEILPGIPDDTFAPNVAIAGLLVLRKKNVRNVFIPHSDRTTGEVSIKKWKLLKAAARSCLQTIAIRFR